MLDPGFLGIDVGSVSVSLVLIDPAGNTTHSGYRFHRGKVRETLHAMLSEIDGAPISGAACTSGSPSIFQGARRFDAHLSLISSCCRRFPGARSIIYVGGEKFGLIRFDEHGAYCGTRSSSSCAAGTGSFLDQQARRLGFPGIDELVSRALNSTGVAPRISTRCAVFARTDLAHAQQEGYGLEEICDGLCRGLSQNIVDTLLGGEKIEGPAVLAGGVAQNASVRRHLQQILGVPLSCPDEAPLLGAIGAALLLAELGDEDTGRTVSPGGLLCAPVEQKEYYFPALPSEAIAEDPAAPDRGVPFTEGVFASRHAVEMDDYLLPGRAGEIGTYLGIDIGSTSTKAIVIDESRTPLAGFYTKTLGSPLTAVQALCEAMGDWQGRAGVSLVFRGAGTTGAGRRFIGAILKADLVVDEITAHARAAFELDPGIDTIIEIGGQDAKFTTMRDGMVTFSHMNTVCAAGTGSFLEEQAARVGCDLRDYSRRVRGARAPLSSDRCAVFMERDINHFFAQGFSTEEILAAALYSVRENYLTKVARGAAIGQKIAFQGATARNAALVEAFRQGLGKPILTSRYCHLAGALGAALLLAEQGHASSTLIGLEALRREIPVRAETCELCRNHCRLRVADVAGETVAYGFLCGRDYDVSRFVNRNRSGFDLRKERARAFSSALGPERAAPAAAIAPGAPAPAPAGKPLIGIPAALGLYGQLPLWKSFFTRLGVSWITSEGFDTGIEAGREVQGAEFCAPLAALHGHVKHLRDRAEWVFLPVLLEEGRRETKDPRVYCYYTQFSSALASGAGDAKMRQRCLMPQASWASRRESTRRELHECLLLAGQSHLSLAAVSRAFEEASAGYDEGLLLLRQRFRAEVSKPGEPSVVLLGRPYNVLSPEMSKGIPEIFGSLGIKTFYQDMVPYGPAEVERVAPLLRTVHWLHAARILEVSCVVADTPNLYPVFLTSFKCSPDSFVIEYFRRILDAKEKPYLILQLDDHDSTLGYETRIEAGVASFRNHARRTSAQGPHAPTSAPAEKAAAGSGRRQSLPVIPRALAALDGRTLLYPNWDPVVNPLLVANLRREGVDAVLLSESSVVIRKAMRHNTGQCLPLSIIAQEAMEMVKERGLDPGRTAIWLPRSNLSCNLGMFVPFLKSLVEAEGSGMERIDVYAGDFFYMEISLRATMNAYKAYLAGGLLRRVGCRLRPYERSAGAADRALAAAQQVLIAGFEGRAPLDECIRRAAGLFDSVAVSGERRPRVAIFGDLYSRDNDVMNQELIHAIEDAGGEALTTPYTEYVRFIIQPYLRKWALAGQHLKSLGYRSLWRAVDGLGGRIRQYFSRFLDPEPPFTDDGSERFIRAFGVRTEHDGESFDNLVKIYHLARAHPELALFVQASPAFCCPSMVTEAMARDIERLTGVPVVSITYDGTGQYRNDVIVPYLKYAARRPGAQPA
jgi:predicted CoA-substrate-specific enzyme activase